MVADLKGDFHRLYAQFCSALGDPNRILILYTLIDGPKNGNDLAEEVGLSQSSISRNLKLLRDGGLVLAERRGVSLIHRLADERVGEALELLRGVLADNLEEQADLARSVLKSQRLSD